MAADSALLKHTQTLAFCRGLFFCFLTLGKQKLLLFSLISSLIYSKQLIITQFTYIYLYYYSRKIPQQLRSIFVREIVYINQMSFKSISDRNTSVPLCLLLCCRRGKYEIVDVKLLVKHVFLLAGGTLEFVFTNTGNYCFINAIFSLISNTRWIMGTFS